MVIGFMLILFPPAAWAGGEGGETGEAGQTELLGPLRIRDMTPFNILSLDMLPAHAVAAGKGSWAVEADLSYTNTFAMSENVRSYLEQRDSREPLTQEDVDAIVGMGEDAYGSQSALRDTNIEEIRANKYQASFGLRSRRGHIVYAFAVTENVANFENTPDVGATLTFA